MNVSNETGRHAGRFLYRTHEVRNNTERGGTVSVVDLETGAAKVLAGHASWDSLDGLTWTPWGTVLFAEERDNGRLFEIVLDSRDPSTAVAVHDRPAVGRLAHEGIQVGPDGAVYVIDEFRGEDSGFGGGIYRFVPDRRGDLSSGKLYALKVTGGAHGTGQGEWVGPIDAATARVSGTAAGGTGYNRPEDLQIIGDTLYAAVTEGPRSGGAEIFDGRVLAIELNSLRVTDFVRPGLNVPVETSSVTGFDNPDNLARTPDGRLMIVEDNVPSDIWVCSRDLDGDGAADDVSLFASLTDNAAEGTGIYFGTDANVLFVNVQHSVVDDGDATWAIRRTSK
jgi:secreted PhoX family phosphatase